MLKRTERIAIHLTPTERKTVERLAKESGYASIARYMREMSLRLFTSTEGPDSRVLKSIRRRWDHLLTE